MSIQSLMSAAHAAGYAMAPSDDLLDEDELAAEELATARENGGELQSAKALTPDVRAVEPVFGTWLRDFLFGWFGGRAAA